MNIIHLIKLFFRYPDKQEAWMSLMMLALVVSILGWMIAFVIRRIRKGHTTLSHSAVKPDWTTRLLEGSMLALLGGFVLFRICIDGGLRSVSMMSVEYAHQHIQFAVVAFAVGLVAVMIALLWRTSIGVILMLLVFCGYWSVLDWPFRLIAPHTKPYTQAGVTLYSVLDVSGLDEAESAEIFVNGVSLGAPPVVLRMDEFLDKVPYWPKPPAGFEDQSDFIAVNRYSQRKVYQEKRSRWMPIRFRGESIKEYGPRYDWGDQGRDYYMQVKLGDEWGLGDFQIRSSGGGSSSFNYIHKCKHTVSSSFLQRTRHIEALLDQARLKDYAPGNAWFETYDRYGTVGYQAISRAKEKWIGYNINYRPIALEPGMQKLLDNWAIWKYQLAQVNNAQSAWQAFERICHDVKGKSEYSTNSVAGRAIELVAPYLDAEQLVDFAESEYHKYRHSSRGGSMGYWPQSESKDRKPGFVYWKSPLLITFRPMHLHAIKYALREVDLILDEKDDRQPNVIELKHVPYLMRNGNRREAKVLGGPIIKKYLLRQNWEPEAGRGGPDPKKSITYNSDLTMEVNRWFLEMIYDKSSLGQSFRKQHSRRMLRLAKRVLNESHFNLTVNQLWFLFLDEVKDRKHPAFVLWPQYANGVMVKRLDTERLHRLWSYLVHLEPVSDVDMYVQAWLRTLNPTFGTGRTGDLSRLPESKRVAIYQAIIHLLEEKPDVVMNAYCSDQHTNPDEVIKDEIIKYGYLRSFREALVKASKTTQFDMLLNEWRRSPEMQKTIPDWLAHTKPNHPLISRLAQSDNPKERLMVMKVLAAHPTPEHQVLLEMLLGDSEQSVREAAKQVEATLAELAATPPAELAGR